MKKLMIVGAMLGFATGLMVGLAQGANWPDVIWRSVIACAIASYLFRWWGRVWLQALRQANEKKMALPQ